MSPTAFTLRLGTRLERIRYGPKLAGESAGAARWRAVAEDIRRVSDDALWELRARNRHELVPSCASVWPASWPSRRRSQAPHEAYSIRIP